MLESSWTPFSTCIVTQPNNVLRIFLAHLLIPCGPCRYYHNHHCMSQPPHHQPNSPNLQMLLLFNTPIHRKELITNPDTYMISQIRSSFKWEKLEWDDWLGKRTAQHHAEIDDSLKGEFLETSNIHGLTVIMKPITVKLVDQWSKRPDERDMIAHPKYMHLMSSLTNLELAPKKLSIVGVPTFHGRNKQITTTDNNCTTVKYVTQPYKKVDRVKRGWRVYDQR